MRDEQVVAIIAAMLATCEAVCGQLSQAHDPSYEFRYSSQSEFIEQARSFVEAARAGEVKPS